MLVLSRKEGQKIRIGDEIVVTIVRVSPRAIRIGIEAPDNVQIIREELLELQQGESEASSPIDMQSHS